MYQLGMIIYYYIAILIYNKWIKFDDLS